MTLSIPDFNSARVLVAGDVMLDRYLFGGTHRISPEAPVPVVHIREEDARPGGAANVAVNLASLGAQTRLTGIVGDDDDANVLEALLTAKGVTSDFVRISGQPTITKTRVQSRGQQLIRLDREERLVAGREEIQAVLARNVAGSRVVILSDYGKGALRDAQAMIKICRAAGCATLIDPKGTDFEKYRGATLLTPNQGEFEAVAGACESDQELIERAIAMVDNLGLDALLVTRSEKGMLLIERGNEPLLLPTLAREVFDVTGAGDTVIATVAAALGSGTALSDAARLANLAAGLVVRKIGVASVTRAEMQIALHQRGQGGRGLLTEAELLSMVAEARQRRERIVLTNGVFDVLHAGHVQYLEEAKALGDRLIVAVNDDDSVKRLKGESRPINALPDRMAVLSGLAAVDWVVPFSEDTPARLISQVLPQVLVKGGDYKPDEIAGAKDVLAAGGEVRVLAFRKGHSSSRIIDRLQD
ncbi:MAG: bifunctional D-glycero-beta-D-manno-heptose-7-phosphate kinase/D-glycero-beta-D-manno-heptose 1-phosphate adenylyltransferase HldE [Woeseia sp.]